MQPNEMLSERDATIDALTEQVADLTAKLEKSRGDGQVDRVEAATHAKNSGNQASKAGDWSEALLAYDQCLSLLEHAAQAGVSVDMTGNFRTAHANASFASLKLEDNEGALTIESCMRCGAQTPY